jgi:hypothetical protein
MNPAMVMRTSAGFVRSSSSVAAQTPHDDIEQGSARSLHKQTELHLANKKHTL